jgi:hypothetical protein
MFLPNQSCKLYRRTDKQDVYGNYSYKAPVTVPCTVTLMDLNVKKTSVRADSSASRGRAEEEIGLARLLFPASTVVNEGDVVSVDGEVLEVIRLFPRRDVLGRPDHLQVDFRRGALPS